MLRGSFSGVSIFVLLTWGASGHAMSILSNAMTNAPAKPTLSEKIQYEGVLADKVVVKKAERRLYLVKHDKPFRTYGIRLGFKPEGHKRYQGDGRTPEGRYSLDWRTANSKFTKALHISYPSYADRLRAIREGKDPGGMIMIHGQPARGGDPELQRVASQEDWTQGCIAVSNMAIDEIWQFTTDGTPIEILP
jgi:murein L,D-transpeptidase YafK